MVIMVMIVSLMITNADDIISFNALTVQWSRNTFVIYFTGNQMGTRRSVHLIEITPEEGEYKPLFLMAYKHLPILDRVLFQDCSALCELRECRRVPGCGTSQWVTFGRLIPKPYVKEFSNKHWCSGNGKRCCFRYTPKSEEALV